MKRTLLKCHLAKNGYDGYAPHNHVMLLNVPPEVYLKKIKGYSIYPSEEWADVIDDPRKAKSVAGFKIVGYNYKEKVEKAHKDLYAFENLHDGIDIEPVAGALGKYVDEVFGSDLNINGRYSSAAVYEIDDSDLIDADRYNTLKDVPSWARDTIKYLMDKEILKGTGDGLDLSMDMIRLLVILHRANVF